MKYLIWSEEHGAWWRPHSGGYVRRISEAGRYSKEDSEAIVESANRYLRPGIPFNEVAVVDPFGDAKEQT